MTNQQINLSRLSGTQREVLRLLYESDDHTATPLAISECCSYAQQRVYDALVALEKLGYIRQIQREGETVRYQVSAEILNQLDY